jgi:sirohydrochlorin ferrochelatase
MAFMKEKKPAYLLIAHGTRDQEGEKAFFNFVEEFRRVFPDRKIEPSFLEICRPSIPEGIEKCIQGGTQEIFVVPLMLFPGRHVKEDIPRQIQEAKGRHPEVDFHYSGPLALKFKKEGSSAEPKMFDLLMDKISQIEEGRGFSSMGFG